MTDRKYGFGALKDRHDLRDFSWQNARRLYRLAPIPDSYEVLGFKEIPVKNQGSVGACVGFATSTLKDYFDTKERGSLVHTSEQFIYVEGRKMEGTYPQDSGMYPRDALKLALNIGIPESKLCPWDEANYNRVCSGQEILMNAALQKIKSFAAIHNTLELREALMQTGPILTGVPVFESWPMVTTTGEVPMPGPDEQILGGHAIDIYAYTPGKFRFRNSWTSEWGDDGDGWLLEEYITTYYPQQMVDLWSVLDIVAGPAPNPPDPTPAAGNFRVQKKQGTAWRTVTSFS